MSFTEDQLADEMEYSEKLEARLASQERALGVAVGALSEIGFADANSIDASAMRMSKTARRALTQIEGEGEKISEA